ncbi:MAG TPA: adenylyl-sulfate kinase [Candidatus Absconditabacterales bacterium]|nr:adenylyl-sulfate kinase [Candidatus Absconditabacterales bacterium]HOQ78772.1 adenylyl-sulfate kinase [Candidatus Absconditabacterales bacterium]HPK27881.1 adenylyl-sulfate kinase [Candidatus Absconditabacterales bacterium]
MSNIQRQPFTMLLTGLSGSGKSTVSDFLCKKIIEEYGVYVDQLDGDKIRSTLNSDLKFSKNDRHKNITRVSKICDKLNKNGRSVIASFICPYASMRKIMKNNIKNLIEVFLNCPLEVCEKRDVKGLYKKARNGEIKNFTGISDVFEIPENPDIILNTHKETITESVNKLINYLSKKYKI